MIGSDQSFTATGVLAQIASQFGIGIVGGVVLGFGLSFLVSRMQLVEGLYALLIASGGLMAFTAINQIGGSGFLGIYLVGLIVGNRRNHASEHVFRVMDGLAWLAQAGMFLVLGLLVNPTQLWEHAGPALLISLFLIFIARPVAVWLSLLPFHFPSREQGFIAWVGLRGAVPIVLSLFPLMAELEGGRFLFDITFAVVLVSLVIQGTSLGWMARRLKLQIPREPGPEASFGFLGTRPDSHVLLAFRIQPSSSLAATAGEALFRFSGLRVIALTRNDRLLFPKRQFVFAVDDLLYLITPERHSEELGVLFRGDSKNAPEARTFFGSFTVHGSAEMAGLADVYGLELAGDRIELTIAEYMRRRLHRRPVEGDVVDIDSVRLTVRTLETGVIASVGLRLLDPEEMKKTADKHKRTAAKTGR